MLIGFFKVYYIPRVYQVAQVQKGYKTMTERREKNRVYIKQH